MSEILFGSKKVFRKWDFHSPATETIAGFERVLAQLRIERQEMSIADNWPNNRDPKSPTA
jgi:hypothetical protein